jgi:ribA/ribD-fused uncharacterized protein
MRANLMKPPYDRESLIQQLSDGPRRKFLFFWGHKSKPGTNGTECLSQWFPASFTLDNVHYLTAEHYMMARKARLFRDNLALDKILSASSPSEAKKLGRAVRGFIESVWNEHRFQIVIDANVAKFRQNAALGEFMLETHDRVIVEASPRDRIWGIGLSQTNPNAEHPDKWRGLNLLGFALMAARDQLRQ